MALEIRSIPVLEGAAAERFVREADENALHPQRSQLHLLTREQFESIKLKRKVYAD